MQHRKWLKSLAVSGLVTVSVAVAASAGAATTAIRSATVTTPGSAPGVQPGSALLRVAHLSPDTAGVDVYVDGQRALGNVNYQTVSNYQTVPAGEHRLQLRPAGAAAATRPILDATRELVSQQAYTVAGVGKNARLRGQVFNDDLTSPVPGAAKLRVIHAAVDVTPVDVDLVGGPTLGTSVSFASATAYAQVLPGLYTLRVRTHSDGATVLTVPNLDLGAGIVYSVAAIGGIAQKPLQALPLVDARGVEVLPAGAVHTGAGGTAVRSERSTPNGIWLLGGALAVGVAAAMIVPLRRRRLA